MEYPQELADFILGMARFCRNEILHSEYEVHLKWSDSPADDDTKESTTRMTINMNHVYLWARITAYPDCVILWENKSYEELAKSVLHEICHLFIEPVADLFMWDAAPSQKGMYRDTIERQTQRIANALYCSFKKDWWKEFLPNELR